MIKILKQQKHVLSNTIVSIYEINKNHFWQDLKTNLNTISILKQNKCSFTRNNYP